MEDPKQRLLDSVLAELDQNGLGDRSLRDIAEAVGTSHRMLIHHFGSREGLLVTIVETVEARERERAIALHPTRTQMGRADAIRDAWRHFARPGQAGRERLFFECYSRALQGEAPFDQMLPGAVDAWVDAIASLEMEFGAAKREARARARLYVALMRGLLLDLLATHDRKGTADALEAFLVGTTDAPSGALA
jgi:AcrR family transcriptional regulator